MNVRVKWLILVLLPLATSSVLAEGDFIKGAKVWAEVCSGCHTYRDQTDFNDNHKASTTYVTHITATDVHYEVWKSYADFKTDVSDWTLVKYRDWFKDRHLLYMFQEEP